MIKAYWIALYTEIKDKNNLQKYTDLAVPILKKYGGIPLIRGGKYKLFSGIEFPRTVVWEFPSLDIAKNCYNSKEYQDSWALAKETVERNLQIVEGLSTE